MKLSKSKINTYLHCPLEFKFRYIDKIESQPNKYMILGSDVHLVAEHFVKKFQSDVSDINIENELLNLVYELDIGYDLGNHINHLASFFREIFINNDYKLFSFEEYLLDEKNNFSGICDIILKNENDKLIIIDYKTSNSNTFSKYRLELSYYKLLVENVYKKEVSHVGIFFTKNGRLRLLEVNDNDNKFKYLNSQEIADSIKILNNVKNGIEKGNFQPKKQFTCKFCNYKSFCEKIV